MATVSTSSLDTIEAIKNKKIPKGDVFEFARAAGLLAVKKTSDVIPDCHPLPIEFSAISYSIDGLDININVEVHTIYKTGVEVEAMHGASIVALTMYDMLKPVDKNIWDYNAKAMEKIPGLNFNNKRTQIVAAFEEQLRKGFAVRSSRLLNELNTFVYMNGRPDHMKGAHDDAIMSLSMALYAADMSFNQLQKNDSKNKAMLESWTLSERTYEPNKSFYSYGTAFDQIGSMDMDNDPNFKDIRNVPGKNQYQEFKWLFAKSK
jgi:molybdenum cofactor biosynthesis protein MoaC